MKALNVLTPKLVFPIFFPRPILIKISTRGVVMQSNSKIHKKLLNEESKALVDLIKDIFSQYSQQDELINLTWDARGHEIYTQILIQIKALVSAEFDKNNYFQQLSWGDNKKDIYNCINQCDIDNPAATIIQLQRLFPTVVEKKYFQSIVKSGNSLGVIQFLENHPSTGSMITLEMICHAANKGYTQLVIAMLPFCYSMNQVQLGAEKLKAGLIETFLTTRPANRLYFLLDTVRELIANNTKDQINFVIEELNLQLKEKLFESCIGKVSHQGQMLKSDELHDIDRYRHSRKSYYGYTELSFLTESVFTLREDKRMSIANIQKNPMYETMYASGKRNAGILRTELEYLFKIIGLECDEDSDFDNEIIFKPAYTKKLIDLGVHYNVNYIKNLLFAQNQFRLLTKSWHAEESRSGENALKRLPLEYVSHTLFPFTGVRNSL